MLEQPDSPTASDAKKQVFDHYLNRLQNEIHDILAGESEYEERVRSLENELGVFKRACFKAEGKNETLHEEIKMLRERLESLETNNKTTQQRIVCLIDGDGTIFATELLLQGKDGGRLAAKQLNESIHYHLPGQSSQPCHLWTYIFYNKRGLLDTFARAGGEFRGVRESFEEFALGFNQSCERFIMVDVGGGKEAADAKIKVLLDEHARSQETFKIVFGGCHDNGYMPQLHSLLTSVHREKLILLPGYTDMAVEIGKLQLPSLIIPGLFIPEKIVVPAFARSGTVATRNATPAINGSADFGPPPGLAPPTIRNDDTDHLSSRESPPPPPYPSQLESVKDITRARRGSFSGSRTSGTASPSPERQRVLLGSAPGGGPMSYRSIVQANTPPQTTVVHANTIQNQRDTKTYGNDNSKKVQARQRRLDPTLPLSQHNPPPCTLFYLAANGCKHGDECRFGHDYILDDDDYDLLQTNAKKVPCPTANRGEPCMFGENCCYGHMCPFLGRCHYNKHGKCKFSGPDMHGEA